MPKLLLKFNAAVLREIPFDKDVFTVGRKADNDIVVDNPAVSGHHCRISRQGGTYFVEDLDSTNGTYVNQKRVQTAGLHHNDVVGVAKHSLVFVSDVAPEVERLLPPSPPADATTIPSYERQQEMASSSAEAGMIGEGELAGFLRVLKGAADGISEYPLKGMSTYIGKSDRVQVPIRGTGLFGSAPEVAASVHRKAEGFLLVAVADGYPIVNGAKVSGSVLLKDGDLIECGATMMQFELRPLS